MLYEKQAVLINYLFLKSSVIFMFAEMGVLVTIFLCNTFKR